MWQMEQEAKKLELEIRNLREAVVDHVAQGKKVALFFLHVRTHLTCCPRTCSCLEQGAPAPRSYATS